MPCMRCNAESTINSSHRECRWPVYGSSRTASRYRPRSAFTLVELLVVMAIIGVLVSLALAGISRVRQRARATECANRMRQIGIALQSHQTVHGHLPRDGENGYGYGVFLLPHVEQSALFDAIRPFRVPFSNAGPPQRRAGKIMVQLYVCPNFEQEWRLPPPHFARSNYMGNIELMESGMDLANVLDGESTTVVVGETIAERSWIEPGTGSMSAAPNAGSFSSRHPEGAHYLLCDGAVKFITNGIDENTMQALGTPNGNDVVGDF